MKAYVCVATAIMAAGCSVPDGDDMSDLRLEIANMNPGDAALLRVWGANRAAAAELENKDPNLRIGVLECTTDIYDDAKAPVSRHEVRVKDALSCLNLSFRVDYDDCLRAMWDKAFTTLYASFGDTSPNPWCRWVSFTPGFDPDDVPDDWRADRISVDAVVRALIASTSPPLGGRLPAGLLGKLCPLASSPDAIGCPGSPEYAPGETPVPGDEGDR